MPAAVSGTTMVPVARVASLLSRAPPTTCNSAKGTESVGESTPTMKYFVFATAHESGPATIFRSPGSTLENATPLAPLATGFAA